MTFHLPHPRLLIHAALVVACAAGFSATGSAAEKSHELPMPTGLQTFLHSAETTRTLATSIKVPTYPRTPAFAWNPVRGATGYQFQLSTRQDFRADNSLIWDSSVATPAASVPLALPWITGPSLFWRVRTLGQGSQSQWTTPPKAFNMRWLRRPEQIRASVVPGLVRWSSVEGATGYQVWFLNAPGGRKTFSTVTNVADEREYYLHGKPQSGPVLWRVRAERVVYGGAKNGLPTASYGPWSSLPAFKSPGPAAAHASPVRLVRAVSDVVSTSLHPRSHKLVPALTLGGAPTIDGTRTLYRTYVFTDRDCVNRVFTGYPVSSPAYAPRSYGGQALPEGKQRMADGTEVEPNELMHNGTGPAKIDLWDTTGSYYAVAVPVRVLEQASAGGPQQVTTTQGNTSTTQTVTPKGEITYQDTALPQDVCATGHLLTFAKGGQTPTPTRGGHPAATGLSQNGRLITAVGWKPHFFGSPLVTWDPASGAVAYQVQWSKSNYPWRPAGAVRTAATSAALPLSPGVWWYRVRGINTSLGGQPAHDLVDPGADRHHPADLFRHGDAGSGEAGVDARGPSPARRHQRARSCRRAAAP